MVKAIRQKNSRHNSNAHYQTHGQRTSRSKLHYVKCGRRSTKIAYRELYDQEAKDLSRASNFLAAKYG